MTASTWRLRVELADEPGALALVAAALGGAGGNVVSIDIHELDGAKAVDEIVVEAAEDWDLDSVVAGIHAAGADLLSCGPTSERMDPMVRGLRYAGALVAADPQLESMELGRAVLELTGGSAAWVSTVEEAAAWEAGRRAVAHDGPIVMRTDDLPASVGLDVKGDVWLLAAPSGGLVAFATRPLSLRFTTSEIERVEALLTLRSVLAERAFFAR